METCGDLAAKRVDRAATEMGDGELGACVVAQRSGGRDWSVHRRRDILTHWKSSGRVE